MTVLRSISDPFGVLLKQFRKRQHLTQQQLAKALDIHRNTIGRWEEGSFLPESKALILDLAKHLHLDEYEARQLLDASLIVPMPAWSVPYLRNPFFTGREKTLAVLHTRLGPGQKVALTQSYALHGLGGIGKTQLALEYAYRYALEYSAIFWIGAETIEQVYASLLRIAERLGLPECAESDQQRIIAAVQRWLEMRGGWLLIWDNLEDLDLLQRYLPAGGQGAILITTQRQALGILAEPLELPPLSNEEGVALLLRRTRQLNGSVLETAQTQQVPLEASARSEAAELVELLEGLPLALDQAGAYIVETGCSLADYLRHYREQRQQVLARRGIHGGAHPLSVATTLQLAVEQAERYHPAAADLLRVCVFLHPEAIPEELFVAGAPHLGPVLGSTVADPYQFDLALAALRSASLVTRHVQTRTLSVHRLVQVVLQDQIEPSATHLWSERVVRMVNATFPEPAFDTWTQCERCLAQALACVPLLETIGTDLPEVGELLYKTGSYLLARGRYKEADSLLGQALTRGEQQHGSNHPALIPRLMKRAELFWRWGTYEHAGLLLQRILNIEEQSLEPDYPEIAETLNNLALLYWQRGEYEQAEPLYQRALCIREEQLGPEHLDTAATLNNLALLYWQRGEYERAEPLYQRALRIKEQQLGAEHPDTANTLQNLAYLYWQRGEYERAEPLYQRALRIREEQLGPEHPLLALTLNNLANLYRDQGKYEQVETLYERALCIQERRLGLEHPDTAITLHDLAVFRRMQGKLDEAISLVRRALTIRSQSLGETHPKTVTTREHYTQLVQEQVNVGNH